MKRLSQFICAAIVFAAGASLTVAGTVEPGNSADLLMMPASPCETATDVMGDPNTPTATADASCSEVAGSVGAEAAVETSLTDQSASASASVQYLFDIGATEGTEGNQVVGNLGFGVSWSGMQQVTDVTGQALVNIHLAVYDISDPGNPTMIASADVHENGIGRDGCTAAECVGDPVADMDSAEGALALVLSRGGSYLVEVGIETEASVLGPLAATSAISDYLDTALIDSLSLSVGADVVALAEQVAENTERIESLEEEVETLQMAVTDLTDEVAMLTDRVVELEGDNADQDQDIADLQMALADLTEIVLTHTHTYLTGRGTGHNNTVVETSAPGVDLEPGKPGNGHGNGNDDDMDGDETSDKMKEIAPGRQRLGNRGNSGR